MLRDRRTGTDAGAVEAAWVRPDRQLPPTGVPAVEARAGLGLRGDCHADPLSPRQVLLASTASYRRLALPAGTLRENFTVSADVRLWPSGSLVALGSEVVLWITFACEPCARLNRHRPGLLRTVGRDRGVLARVVRGGRVRVGDRIRVLPGALPALRDSWQARVHQIVESVPHGSVVEYAQLARLAGTPLAYCRTFPRVLAALPGPIADRAVSAGARPEADRWSGADLFLPNVRRGSGHPAVTSE